MSWRLHAACLDADANLFFIERGASTRPAKTICGMCVVQVECLDYAMDRNERIGIWGGHSASERKQLRRLDNRNSVR